MSDYLDSGSMYGSLETPDALTMPAPAAASSPAVKASSSTTNDVGSPVKTMPAIVKEKIPAASDTDTSTRQTIQKMCEYITAGVSDDHCRWWALQALQRYALGSTNPEQLCWGVWWLVKHAVKFAKDEPRLFAVGEPEALDLLIAPAVLVRDKAPKEDCDGFTMLVCCLLKILGIPSVIVTVAADSENPDRWSHVFPMAQLKDAYLPLDASHGKFPGWMVPREHIYRWQAWGLDGSPVQAAPPATNTLHGYVPKGVGLRRRGMGQDNLSEAGGDSGGFVGPVAPGGSVSDYANAVFVPPVESGGALFPSSPTASSSPTNWAGIFNSLVSGGVKAFQTSQLPSNYFTDPNTGKLIYAPGNVPGGAGFPGFSSASLGSFTEILPWLGIGLVAVLVLGSLGGKR